MAISVDAQNAAALEQRHTAQLSRRHILDVDDFSADEFHLVFEAADAMREVLARPISKVPALRGKTVIILFYEVSTRTRVSFELAAKTLSAEVINMSASGSSIEKGESLVDTIRTLTALYADVLVMRHAQSGAPYLAARHFPGSVINAGDGLHAHPTQALLDAYTVREKLGRLNGIKLTIVGDVLHSRVARSDIWAFTKLGAHVTLCAPPTLLPKLDQPAVAAEYGLPPVELETDADRAVRDADVVMGLRLQKERQEGGLLPSLREYSRLYQLNSRRLALAKPGALLMHPGPMNEGVEIAADVVTRAESVIQNQVTNGMAIRMALLYMLSGGHTA